MESETTAQTAPKSAQPQGEHRWLEQLVGDWTMEAEVISGPDKPPDTVTGRESVRSIGGLWFISEGTMDSPDLGTGTSVMTLGYDPAVNHFVGTWIGSMMTRLWIYEGSLNESETMLTLSSEGPGMAGDGTTGNYRDVIEILSPDHRTLTSFMQSEDGSWQRFMTAHYRRR